MKPWSYEGVGLLSEVKELKSKAGQVFAWAAKFQTLGITVSCDITEVQYKELVGKIGEVYQCAGMFAANFAGELVLKLNQYKKAAA